MLWSGGSKTENGVDLIVNNWVVEKVVEVERTSKDLMKVKNIIRFEDWEVVCCYCPQIGSQKWESRNSVMDIVVTNEKGSYLW